MRIDAAIASWRLRSMLVACRTPRRRPGSAAQAYADAALGFHMLNVARAGAGLQAPETYCSRQNDPPP